MVMVDISSGKATPHPPSFSARLSLPCYVFSPRARNLLRSQRVHFLRRTLSALYYYKSCSIRIALWVSFFMINTSVFSRLFPSCGRLFACDSILLFSLVGGGCKSFTTPRVLETVLVIILLIQRPSGLASINLKTRREWCEG